MDKRKFGYYVFGGMLIGAMLGFAWSANGNVLAELGIGALIGTFVGWFAAAAAIEIQKQKKENK